MKTVRGLALLLFAIIGLCGFIGFFILSPRSIFTQLFGLVLALIILGGAVIMFIIGKRHRRHLSPPTTPPPPDKPASIMKEASPQTPDQPVLESKTLEEITKE